MAKLVVISKSHAGLTHELGKRWVTIGRNPGNLFQITESSVSGQHCEVLWQGMELLVRDLRSTNGTFIKDALISEGVLGIGGVLRLGEVELRLEVSAVTSRSLCGPAPLPPERSTPDRAFSASPQVPFDPEPLDGAKNTVPLPARINGNPGTRQHQLLFVDDSMAFLELVGEVFQAFSNGEWEIHQACGADQALSLIQARSIELAVLDLAMPMLDGQQLLAMLHRRHPDVKLVILTGLADEARRAQCLTAGAELFLEKPVTRDGLRFVFNVLHDLLAWKHGDGFSGTLQHVGLTDIIQIECLRRSSCILEIHTAQLQGEIYIESGALVHAVAGAVSGTPALHHLLSLNDGRFHQYPYRQPADRTLKGSWEGLLMESAQIRDEEHNARADDKTTLLTRPSAAPKPAASEDYYPAPKPEASESKTPAPAEPFDLPELGDGIVLVSTYDGKWHPSDGEK